MTTPMLTDSGLETWLIFHRGFDLPEFASFTLLDDPDGRAALAEYFGDHVRAAADAGVGIVLETPTWRANPDWGARLGYDDAALDRVNHDAVALVREAASAADGIEVVVSGNLGPRGDGYDPGELLSPEEAQAYHDPQIASLVAGGADRITMLTATHVGEAAGVILAARARGAPVVAAFTVETDGRLPSGQPLAEALAETDALTDGAALHLGVNCAHPEHFAATFATDPAAVGRVGLLRANASRMSHAELDEAEDLDDGDPAELGSQYAQLLVDHPDLQVLGGCCGTDVRHIRAIAAACLTP